MTSPLRLHIEHGLATMTFCAPERANVLDLAMARAFAAAVQQIASDDSVRAILITGEGKQFCAGGDINAFADRSRELTDVLEELLDPVLEGMKLLNSNTFLSNWFNALFKGIICLTQPSEYISCGLISGW